MGNQVITLLPNYSITSLVIMLNPEQQHALDTLFAQVGEQETAVSPPGFLQTWLGLSDEQLKGYWQEVIVQKNRLADPVSTVDRKQPTGCRLWFFGSLSSRLLCC